MAKTTAVLIAALLGLSCGRAAPAGFLVETATHRVRIETKPSPVPLNEHFELVVTVTGSPATGIAVDARMPAHRHGMNTQVQIEDLGGGRFQVKGLLFHMPGDWELLVDVLDASGRKERAMQPFHLE